MGYHMLSNLTRGHLVSHLDMAQNLNSVIYPQKEVFIESYCPNDFVMYLKIYFVIYNMATYIFQGYLPVHCIYQLLKSRVFSKHKVPIKVTFFFSPSSKTSLPLHINPSSITDHDLYYRQAFQEGISTSDQYSLGTPHYL